jgi:hypothetical protein
MCSIRKPPTICVVTSIGFVLPFAMDGVHVPPVFQIMLVSQTAVSILFWWDPAVSRNTIVHRVDAALARATVVSVIGYKLFLGSPLCGQLLRCAPENLPEFFVTMLFMFVCFYISHRVSSHRSSMGEAHAWGSPQHVAAHALAHLWCSRGVYLAFWKL